MPAVIALCLQINLEEMTPATSKREIAKAILPDRADKQGAQLPVKQAAEAEADLVAPVQPRWARSLRQGRRVRGPGRPSAHRRADASGAAAAGGQHGAAPRCRKVKLAGAGAGSVLSRLPPPGRRRGLARNRAVLRVPQLPQNNLPRPAGTAQDGHPPGKIKLRGVP